MTKTDMLFIRACKMEHHIAIRRINRLYKSFYLSVSDPIKRKHALIQILAEIVASSNPFLTMDTVNISLKASKISEDEFFDFMINTLISRIQATPVSKFNSLISPASFRNKKM